MPHYQTFFERLLAFGEVIKDGIEVLSRFCAGKSRVNPSVKPVLVLYRLLIEFVPVGKRAHFSAAGGLEVERPEIEAAVEQELINLLLGCVQELRLAHACQILPVLRFLLDALSFGPTLDSK